jgi:hypothetical protein
MHTVRARLWGFRFRVYVPKSDMGCDVLSCGEGEEEAACPPPADQLSLCAQCMQALVYKTVCSQMADDVAGGHSVCLVVAGLPQSGKRFSLIGKLGEFVAMGLAPRLAADILERAEQSRADGQLSCKVGIYQVLWVGGVWGVGCGV